VPATVDLAGSEPRVARVVEDVDDSVREAAAPARVVMAAAELPVGHVASCLDQCVVEGAGVLKQGALFRPGFEEQAAGAGCVPVGGRDVCPGQLPVVTGPPQRR